MSTPNTIPFTYHIAWSKINKHYYGVKYAIGCNPTDLWTNYYTSSRIVEQYRNEHGEPDIIEVRKVFDNSLDAVTWEKNVLTRLDVANNDNWLNQVISGLWDLSHEQRSSIISSAVTEWHSEMSIEQKVARNEKLSDSRNRYIANRTPEQEQRDYEARLVGASKSGDKISAAAKERYACDDYRQKLKDAHNTPEYKKAASNKTIELFENEEYKANHTASVTTQEYRDKISAANKRRFENDDARKQISLSMKAHCSHTHTREQMSLNAKKSTGNRLATRYMNKLSDAQITTMSIDEVVNGVSGQVEHDFDIQRLTDKVNIRKAKL